MVAHDRLDGAVVAVEPASCALVPLVAAVHLRSGRAGGAGEEGSVHRGIDGIAQPPADVEHALEARGGELGVERLTRGEAVDGPADRDRQARPGALRTTSRTCRLLGGACNRTTGTGTQGELIAKLKERGQLARVTIRGQVEVRRTQQWRTYGRKVWDETWPGDRVGR